MTSAELPSSSLSLPPSSPRLPVELLAQIVEEAAGDRDKLDYTTLRHLCLTSKSILSFARQALYREITIIFCDAFGGPDSHEDDWDDYDYESDMDELDGIDWDEAHVTTDGDGVELTLSEAPHLARLVVGLTLDYQNMDFSTRWLPRHCIRAICAACPGLRRFRAFNTDGLEMDAIADILVRLSPPLVEYEVDLLSSLPRLINALPSLRHLRIDQVKLEDYMAEAFNFPSTLLSLRLGGWRGGPSLPALPTALQNLAPSLQSLNLQGSAVTQLGAHLASFKALVHLTIGTLHDEALTQCQDSMLDSIASLEHLQFLHFGARTLLFPQIARLPPQLHVIHFDAQMELRVVEGLMTGESRGALRQVVLERSEDEEWEELGAEHGWQVERFGQKVVFVR